MPVEPRPFTPHPYQLLIRDHQLDLPRAGVWAGMGTGKTASTLSAIDLLQLAGVERRPALVLAPLRVALNTWPDEAAKWQQLASMEVRPIVGTAARRKDVLRDDNASLFTINYDNLPWLIETLDGRWPFGLVVADESTRLKSFRLGGGGGKRAKAIARIAHAAASRWVNLTGTPSPNGLADLWGQTWFLDRGERLGRTYGAFTDRWFRTGHDGLGLEALPHADREIQTLLRDLHLTIDAKDWFDLEEPITRRVTVRLPARARGHYREMERELFTLIENHEIEAANAAVRSTKCLQIASGAVYVDDSRAWRELHDAKVQALESIVAEASGAPVLVAYHWEHDRDRLLKAFPQARLLDQDPATIRQWNAGRLPMLLAHPASAGHGLNLQDGGNILVFFSHWWAMEERAQIIERIGPTRQKQAGHNRPVFIYEIVAEDTLDETVIERHATKREVQDLLLEACKRNRRGSNDGSQHSLHAGIYSGPARRALR